MPIRLVKGSASGIVCDAEVRVAKLDVAESLIKSYEENKLVFLVKSPKWIDGKHSEVEALSNCYTEILKSAENSQCESVAIPLNFKGCGFPKEMVYPIAIKSIGDYLINSDLTVYLIVENIRTFKSGFALKDRLLKFISSIYIPKSKTKPKADDFVWKPSRRYPHVFAQRGFKQAKAHRSRMASPRASRKLARTRIGSRKTFPDSLRARLLDELAQKPSETFSEAVLRIITEKGWKDPDCYKAANMDKRLFSKIRSNPNYHPEKKTAISLAIALELNLSETNDLLRKAGYALSKTDKRDVIVMFFIEQEIFNILELDGVLLENGQEMLTKYD